MKKIEVNLLAEKERSYPIFIGENLLDNIYNLIRKYTNAKKFLVVTNDTIYPLYGEKLKHENSEFLILPDGEIYKNMDVLALIIDKALNIKLERKDCIIALGGGVVGDMAGFAASIIQRGIDFVQVPTTLLAQVDSSVGGKVAVNHAAGKNLIGAFYQPKVVIADISVLNTLDDRQFKTGLSEVLKYAFIEKTVNAEENYNLFEFLEKNKDEIISKNPEILAKLIEICCKLKSAVVNQDEKEKGLRAVLNFGHTYAHAIENLTGYEKYTHGEAVAMGMKLIFDLALFKNFINNDYYNKALKLLSEYSLKTEFSDVFDCELFYETMFSDKKVSGGKINFVVPIAEKEVEIKNNIDKNIVLKGIVKM